MSSIHGRVRAREAGEQWLAGPGRAPPLADKFRMTVRALHVSRLEAFVAGFTGGADQAEADFAIERSTGQRQLDDADALIREACVLFDRYARHHWNRADEAKLDGDMEAERASLEKARVNLLMLVRLKAWLAGEDRYPVNPAEALRSMAEEMAGELGLTVDHDAFDDAAAHLAAPVEHITFLRDQPGLECGSRRYTDRGDAHPFYGGPCRVVPFPIPAEIAEDGQLVPIDDGKTREDCRARFDNVVNFGGFEPDLRSEAKKWRDQFQDEGRRARRAGLGIEDCPHFPRIPGGRDMFSGVSPGSEWIIGWKEEDGRRGNVRPVTDGPLADLGTVEGLMGAAGMTDAARSLSMAKATAFRLQTPDPRFDPAKPVVVNGYLFHPATEAR